MSASGQQRPLTILSAQRPLWSVKQEFSATEISPAAFAHEAVIQMTGNLYSERPFISRANNRADSPAAGVLRCLS